MEIEDLPNNVLLVQQGRSSNFTLKLRPRYLIHNHGLWQGLWLVPMYSIVVIDIWCLYATLTVQNATVPYCLHLCLNRAVGSLMISITAMSDESETDSVQKPLLVKVGAMYF